MFSVGARQRDAAMIQTLHDRHGAALWRFATGLTRDTHLAEDVVQEALLRAWRRPAVLELQDAEARSWLFTVVRNLVIDHHRSARNRREIARDELPERVHDDGTDAALDTWLVTDALAGLSLEHRTVIVQAYYGRLPVAEIADRLGVPVGTVKSRLHYGIRALRLALQEKGVTSQ